MTGTLTMPRMGETMERGRVVAWLKKPGEAFKRGEALLEVETDKTVAEVPAFEAGQLREILVQEGGEAEVGAPIGLYDSASSIAPPPAEADTLRTIAMPRMGETMEEGRVAAWLKQPGDAFRRGEVIVEIETDKTTVEVPALDDGVLVEIVAGPGDATAVGGVIGRFRGMGDAAAREGASPTVSTVAPPAADTARPAAPSRRDEPGAAVQRLRATPPARRLARQRNVPLDTLVGTGRRGRIERADVEAVLGGGGRPATIAGGGTAGLSFVDLPQGRMAYRAWGPEQAARRVLFLHGFAADSATWAGFAGALARLGSHVVAPDLPGHGETAIEADGFDALVPVLAAFAGALGLSQADLVGHSLGGALAARAAASGELRSARLTLIAPAGLGGAIDADFITGMATVTSGGGLVHLLRRLARNPPALSRPQLDAMAVTLRKRRLTSLAEAVVEGGRQQIDIVPDLAALGAPTRLIWGLEDRIIPWTDVAAAPSTCAVHLIRGAGHMPHWDAPQALAALFASG